MTVKTSINNISFYLHMFETSLKSRSLPNAKTIHQHFLKNNTIHSPTILDKLTRVYISFNKLNHARQVFDEMPNPEKMNNVLLWNQLIRAYAWEGPVHHAIELFAEMMQYGVIPNKYTYPFVLKACSAVRDVGIGKMIGRMIHGRVEIEGLADDVYVCTGLVDFYAKCGLLGDARKVFDEMCERDVVAWNAMIAGSSLHGLCDETIGLVKEMQEAGLRPNSSTVVAVLPAIGEACELMLGKGVHAFCLRRRYDGDLVVGTGLLDMYGKCECLDYARRVFDLINVKNEVTWSAMIAACVACDSTMDAVELFDNVVKNSCAYTSPVILATVLRACANLTDIKKGRWIHGYSIKLGFVSYLIVSNTIVSLYSKCGIIDDAMMFFNEMDVKDTVSYNTIISGCVQNGDAEVAFNMFNNMRSFGVNPDVETMVGFFPACSHLAALQHGACGHSYSVIQGFTESTKVCNAIIDMYSKCGKIDMARFQSR